MSTRDLMLAALVKLAEERDHSGSVIDKAAPWVKRGITSAVPAAVAANYMIPLGDSPIKKRIVAGMGILGGAAGLFDMAAHRNDAPAKTAEVMRKVAALAGDLRRLGMAGVKRPAFPTAGSLTQPSQRLKKSQNLGKFFGSVKPKDLIKPGPSIAQVSAKI